MKITWIGHSCFLIEKDNFKLCDSLIYAKEGTLEEKLNELFYIIN